ncbi:MAG: glycosyltransferase family 4 protein [Anaerolineae bacterium]|nr:glycosyltransferase family 4 protein [Anaerolineae bacterium]
MNVALLHYAAPPVVGGVEGVIAHHARLLAEDGHRVRIIAGRGAAFDPRVEFVPLPLADSRHPDVLRVKAELDRGQRTAAFDALRDALVEQLRAALASIDVLIAHNVCSLNKNLALTAALHRLNETATAPRLVLWHHDLAWTTPRYRPELHDGYPWDLLCTPWKGVCQVVISSARRAELAALMGLPQAAIAVVPNGLAPAHFYKLERLTAELVEQLGLFEATLILLLPVRLTPRKNIELALRVLAELRRIVPGSVLVVTGPLGPHNERNSDYYARLRALRAELELEGAAHFLAEHYEGFLPDAVISDFFRLCDALFMPSREEGFGLPLLEAAFDHKPVFCSDIPALRELGQDLVDYFSPDDDPRLVAERVAARLQTERTYLNARRARESYTWKGVYRSYIAPLLNAL